MSTHGVGQKNEVFIVGFWAMQKGSHNQCGQECVGDMHSFELMTASCGGALCRLKTTNAMFLGVREEGSALSYCSVCG